MKKASSTKPEFKLTRENWKKLKKNIAACEARAAEKVAKMKK